MSLESVLNNMRQAEFSSKNNIRKCYEEKIPTTKVDYFNLLMNGIDVMSILSTLKKETGLTFEFFKIKYFGEEVFAFADTTGKNRFHLEENENSYIYLIDNAKEEFSDSAIQGILYAFKIKSYLA